MSTSIPFWSLVEEPVASLRAISAYLHHCSLDETLVELVFLRASQINGCAYCLDMHARALRQRGERQQRLDTLAAWREAPGFSARERAALEWTEAVTRLADRPVPDSLYEAARRAFSDKELAELTMAIAVINAWNRLCASLRVAPAERP